MNLIRLYTENLLYNEFQDRISYQLSFRIEGSYKKLFLVLSEFESFSLMMTMRADKKASLTYDLLKNFAKYFQIRFNRVVIHKFVDGVFSFHIVCQRKGNEYTIEASPGDAIALATRIKIPIFTYQNIVDEAGILQLPSMEQEDQEETENATQKTVREPHAKWKSYLTEELETLLNEALENEDYETAVQIRDEIARREIL